MNGFNPNLPSFNTNSFVNCVNLDREEEVVAFTSDVLTNSFSSESGYEENPNPIKNDFSSSSTAAIFSSFSSCPSNSSQREVRPINRVGKWNVFSTTNDGACGLHAFYGNQDRTGVY